MKKPIIGMPMNAKASFEVWFDGYYIDYIGKVDATSIIKAGGIPIGLPQTTNEEIIDGYLASIDGLLVLGGSDVSPALYNEDTHPLCQEIDYHRDDFEALLITKAIELKKPMVLVCRGLQLLNVLLGGTLYQDLSLNEKIKVKHSCLKDGSREVHAINVVEKDSLFYKIMQEDKMYVNSIHHQIIKDLAPNLKVVATANDGAIEVVELNNSDQFLIATQFHPEILVGKHDSKFVKVFEELVKQAAK